MPARTVLVVGTASHVGKSTVAAGLCRHLAQAGVDVVPFKAQNMSNNARAVVDPSGGYGEIGVSQYVQARAARITPTTDMNPVLLKPRGDGESQLVVDGEPVANVAAGDYYADYWADARAAAASAHDRLAREHEIIVAEGAGSTAEPNLTDRDLANVETARFADRGEPEGHPPTLDEPGGTDVVLVADIERGGAFASVVGTLELAPDAVSDRVTGVIITKFRGDRIVLEPALDDLESRTGVPVLGVLPYDDPGLPEEDSVALPAVGERTVRGADDAPPNHQVTVGVPRLRRLSNATDLEPLAAEVGVRVAYLPPNASLTDMDAVVVPGSKNTVDDLLALRAAGFDEQLRAFDGPVVGLCAGYQLLGQRLLDAHVEGTGDAETVPGVGLLPVETTFSPAKRVEAVTRVVDGCGPLAGATGEATGYEIHMGETRALEPVVRPVGPNSAARGSVLGTYLHGLFENDGVRRAFVDAVFAHAEREQPAADDQRHNPYEAAADLVATHVDLGPLGLGGVT
jgi:adenosylcobyric acid synthase